MAGLMATKVRIGTYFSPLAFFMLIGCANIYFVSVFTIDLSEGGETLATEITGLVISKAQEKGGKCQLSTNPSDRWFCSVGIKEVTEISVGYNLDDEFSVVITSVGAPIFPPTKRAIQSGDYLPKGVEEMEFWVADFLESFPVVEAFRMHDSRLYDIEF